MAKHCQKQAENNKNSLNLLNKLWGYIPILQDLRPCIKFYKCIVFRKLNFLKNAMVILIFLPKINVFEKITKYTFL